MNPGRQCNSAILAIITSVSSSYKTVDACGRTRQGPNAVAGAERGPHRFKSDPAAGTYDENIGHDQFIFVFGPVLNKQDTC